MKTEISTPLGELTIITDQHHWMFLVALLIDLTRELSVPIPKTLYYGPMEYEELLSTADFQDVHMTGRRTSDIVEYWYRDQMILVYTTRTKLSETDLKGFLAHQLLHHDDNLNHRNVTSYALCCASNCDLDYPDVCINYVKICTDTLRNISVSTRLPIKYRRLNLMRNLKRAERSIQDAKIIKNKAQRQLALLYCIILSTGLALFNETEERAIALQSLSLNMYPELKTIQKFLNEQFNTVLNELLNQKFEEHFLSEINQLLCDLMHKILV
jgi:hypothetical protein